MEQNNPNHWRYRKNKAAGILDKMEVEKKRKAKEGLITFDIEVNGEKSTKTINADYDSIKALSRDEQVVICKAFGIRGYSDLKEEGLIKKILAKVASKKKERGGVTTVDTPGLLPKKKLKISDDKEKEKK